MAGTSSSSNCEGADAVCVLASDGIREPLLDERSYRVLRLSNKLEVALVHDSKTDRASACMTVNVGYFNDPEDIPGLAHATEHLLFQGTKRYDGSAYRPLENSSTNSFEYPSDNEYEEYLAMHSVSILSFLSMTNIKRLAYCKV